MGGFMRIELTKPWRGKKAGDVIEWPDPMAERMIEDGIAVREGVAKISKPNADKMVRPRKTRKK